jgi:hypothetical protein
VGFVKDKQQGLKNMTGWSTPMVIIGYSKGAKAYRMMDPNFGCVHVSHNINFDEDRGWVWNSVGGGSELVE